ncbi:jacalin-like lectin [Dickeya undicola]|uniref:jacalin-like lectin n=1 Tax=Dickeya undicola TaxID=1577887 RepID=UPI003F24382D
MSSIVTSIFGGNGGSPFSNQMVYKIGLRTGSRVDQIQINEEKHGGDGGSPQGAITLLNNEYINKIYIRSGSEIDYANFVTNHGNSIQGGGNGGSEHEIHGIRVLYIGGRSGSRVDALDITYVKDYVPSKVIAENVGFILSYVAPFTELEEYTDSHQKTVDSYKQVTEHMLDQKYSASVQGEYYVKVSASTDIEIKDTNLVTIETELTKELEHSIRKTLKVPENYVGITLVNGTILLGEDDCYWMHPTAEPAYSVIKQSDYANLLNHYDLTGELYTQMPDLKKYKKIQNGYVYYDE